jgi:hypothetical protein
VRGKGEVVEEINVFGSSVLSWQLAAYLLASQAVVELELRYSIARWGLPYWLNPLALYCKSK